MDKLRITLKPETYIWLHFIVGGMTGMVGSGILPIEKSHLG